MRVWLAHNLGLKLLSVVLAVVLWALVVGEQKVDVVMTAPLELNLPDNLALVSDPPDSVEIHLRGPRTLVTTLSRRDIVPNVLPARYAEGENIIQLRREAIRVPRGIQVMDVTPPRIRLVLEPIVEREVDVQPRLEGKPADGFVLRRVTAFPARVRLVGPASELRRVTRVTTQPVSLDGRRAPFSVQALLEPVGRQVRAPDDVISVQVDIGGKHS
jgi:hypothetical protein